MSVHSSIASDPVLTFVPWATEDERAVRLRLNNARNLASAKATSTDSDRARQLYWMVNEVASAWVFAPATADDLKDVADLLVRLFLSAGDFERIEGKFS